MDSDELYDSLDDDDPSPHQSKGDSQRRTTVFCDGKSKRPLNNNRNADATLINTPRSDKKTPNEKNDTVYDRTSKRFENLKKIEAECDLTDAVPLYAGETPKQQVRQAITKRTSKDECSPGGEKQSNLPAKVKSQKDRRKTPVNFKEQKTYSNIFHARMGRLNPERVEVTETARAEYGGETNRSNVSNVSSHFSDAKSSISDSTSFYIDLILKKKDATQPKLILSKSTKSLKNAETERLEESELNFKSVSQFIGPQSISRNDGATSKRSKSKLSMVTPAILGSLGPDMGSIQDKLSLLKKRRSYGQRVSDRNRIKIREMQILKDLSEEIKKARM